MQKNIEPSVSFLLGAGFSAPMGYPIGKDLNKKLLNCSGNDFSFHTNGSLCRSADGSKPDFGFKTSYDAEFDFCKDLMHFFNETKSNFDYEKFYDFFMFEAKDDPLLNLDFEKKLYDTKKDLKQLLLTIKYIYIVNLLDYT